MNNADTRCSTESDVQWIVQEYIDIKDENGFASDIRIIQQRGGDGQLKTTLMHGRRSAEQKNGLTNLDKGGVIDFDIEERVVREGFTCADLITICDTVISKVEQVADVVGEVGHDIAIAQVKGEKVLYYIEGNTMPGYIFRNWAEIKLSGNISLLSEQELLLIKSPLEYCKFLMEK